MTQASGVCLTAGGQIVLVSKDDSYWSLPGGHPEPGESLEAALAREVWEESCARAARIAYFGSQDVVDRGSPSPPYRYYQSRFWARVALEPFAPRFETRHRRLVMPCELVGALNWGATGIARAILSAALDAEHRLGAESS